MSFLLGGFSALSYLVSLLGYRVAGALAYLCSHQISLTDFKTFHCWKVRSPTLRENLWWSSEMDTQLGSE